MPDWRRRLLRMEQKGAQRLAIIQIAWDLRPDTYEGACYVAALEQASSVRAVVILPKKAPSGEAWASWAREVMVHG
jgi:hypothetical protein